MQIEGLMVHSSFGCLLYRPQNAHSVSWMLFLCFPQVCKCFTVCNYIIKKWYDERWL